MVRSFLVTSGKSVSAGNLVSYVNGQVQPSRFDVLRSGNPTTLATSRSVQLIRASKLSTNRFVIAFEFDDKVHAMLGEAYGNEVALGQAKVVLDGTPTAVHQIAVLGTGPDRFVVAAETGKAGDARTQFLTGLISGSEFIIAGQTSLRHDIVQDELSLAALSSERFVCATLKHEDRIYVHVMEFSGNTPSLVDSGSWSGRFDTVKIAVLSPERFVTAQASSRGADAVAWCMNGNTLSTCASGGFSGNGVELASGLSAYRFVMAYDGTYLRIGEVSGTTITFQDKFDPGNFTQAVALSTGDFVLTKTTASGLEARHVGLAGDSFTRPREPVILTLPASFDPQEPDLAPLSTDGFLVAACDRALIAAVPGHLGPGPVIGVARTAATGLQSASIVLNSSVSDGHVSLQAGNVYYAQTDGSLSTQVTGRPVGLAFSPTEILLTADSFGVTGLKNFIQPHPRDPGKEIRFVCLEGNESGTYFRGKTRLVNGRAEIPVPEAWRLVTGAEGITVQVTPIRSFARLSIWEASRERILVRGTEDCEFAYLVNGVRRGFEDFEPIQDNVTFRPCWKGVPFAPGLRQPLRDMLVESGLLGPDYTPDEATAARLGWNLLERERR